MSEGMDEGDILKIEKVDILRDDTSLDIFNKFQKS
jgi:methionyl-tRNA formyltransferase